nr:uncharacterized protein LOC107445002 [Parasteatoda tepidariorum]
MKNRLNQVLVDKNPDKKIANISTSHLLQRSSNQRGKWKTESLAKSSTEEMYNSMISNYENRFQMAFKEIEEYRLSLHFIEQQLEAVLSSVGDKLYQNALPCLTAILNGNNFKEELVQKFSAMFTQVQQIIASKVSDNKNLSEEVETLKFEILNLKSNENTNICQKENHPPDESSLSNDGRICKSKEDKTVSEQKEELASTLAQIKEEKSKLEAQKLVLIKSFMKQSSSNSPKCSNSVPSFCVLTTKNGVTSVPAIHQLKECLSYPDSMAKSLSPLWKADLSTSLQSSPSTSVFEDSPSSSFPVFTSPPILNDDLPNWARTVRNTSICEEDSVNLEGFAAEGDVIKTDNISAIQSFEEDNLAKLKAAAEDIESRRINFFAKGK